ncbi:hypothetical protein [Actinospica sp.]|uniref:hypothetical protein n=1 Tax=Actinospica sp. TaxID=1872142 RepID=UPI002CAE668F|nr:hypothetical protein [Actinospica sp.]HWG27083.1 hypothetical protein [Actinospica sp.]
MNTILESLPIRILGALLLVGALDPARWPDYLSPQWFLGGAALVVGLWAAAPIVDRPEMRSHRLRHQLLRYRNTLLVAAAALLAAFQGPPVWLTAVEPALLLTYLMFVDAGTAPGRPAGQQLSHAGYAYAASALVLLAALAPVSGGGWGRIVAGIAVLGTLGLLLATLRLRYTAGYRESGATQAARRH